MYDNPERAFTKKGEPKLSRKIYNFLVWEEDGHTYEVADVDREHNDAQVTETWYDDENEAEMSGTSRWAIKQDNRSEFVCPIDDISFRLHSVDAKNSVEIRARKEKE